MFGRGEEAVKLGEEAGRRSKARSIEVERKKMATETSVMGVIRASRPSFRNSHDKATFALHAAFLAAGYALTATGRAALAGNPPEGEEEVGIEGWNEFEDSYGFVYAKRTEKGKKRRVLVKCLPVGDVLAVDALCLDREQKEPLNLQINVKDYVPEDSARTGNYERFYQNFKRLVDSFNKNVLAELELPAEVGCSSSTERGRYQGMSLLRQMLNPTSGPNLIPRLYIPLLFLIPGLTISTPGPAPASSPEGRPGDGSMLVGPHDPRFGRVDRPDLGYPGGLAGIPPGARYDPIGPPDVPGFEPGRFIRPPRRPGGGTHPDLEHFQGPDYF